MAIKIQDSITELNTAVAKDSSETINNPDTSHRVFTQFNGLLVINNDRIDCEVRLDNENTANKKFIVPKNGGVLDITPEMGLQYSFIQNVNSSSDLAQTVNKIRFKLYRGVVI